MTHYELFIGWRYLRAKPFQTAMSITGVVLGVVVLIVTYSVWSGLEEELRGSLLGSEAHLVVDRAGEGFAGYEDFIAQVLTIPGVVAAAPTVESEALLQSPTSSQRRAGAMIRGVDPARAGDVVNVDEYLASGELRFDRDDLIEAGRRRLAEGDTVKGGIILGSGLARRLGVRAGDPIVMYAAFHQVGGQFVPVVRNFVVIDTYESGLYEIDSGVAYIDFGVAQDVFNTNGRASRVHVGLDDADGAARVKEDILARHGLLYVPRTWQEMRGEFFFWLRVEKIGAMVMLGAIVLVAGFSIAIALVMLVREKTREIGILRAMGARAQTVRSIFVLHGAVVGATGITLGTGLGLLVCGAVALYEIPLPGSVYQIEHVPVTLSWRFIALVDTLTMAMCLVMAWVPAKRAADMHPVEALRYE